MPRTTIVIHGVGHTSLATVGSAVARTLGFGTTRQSTIHRDGTTFLEFADEARGDRVLEVSRADLMRPRATAVGILRHVWHIVTSMVDVALAKGGDGASWTIRLYRWLVFPMTIGAGTLALATAAAASVDVAWLRYSILAAFTVAMAVATLRLHRYGRTYGVLWLWTALIPRIP